MLFSVFMAEASAHNSRIRPSLSPPSRNPCGAAMRSRLSPSKSAETIAQQRDLQAPLPHERFSIDVHGRSCNFRFFLLLFSFWPEFFTSPPAASNGAFPHLENSKIPIPPEKVRKRCPSPTSSPSGGGFFRKTRNSFLTQDPSKDGAAIPPTFHEKLQGPSACNPRPFFPTDHRPSPLGQTMGVFSANTSPGRAHQRESLRGPSFQWREPLASRWPCGHGPRGPFSFERDFEAAEAYQNSLARENATFLPRFFLENQTISWSPPVKSLQPFQKRHRLPSIKPVPLQHDYTTWRLLDKTPSSGPCPETFTIRNLRREIHPPPPPSPSRKSITRNRLEGSPRRAMLPPAAQVLITRGKELDRFGFVTTCYVFFFFLRETAVQASVLCAV